MKSQLSEIQSGALPRFLRATCIAALLPVLVLLLSIQSSRAGSATWKATPPTGDWNTATNWTAGGPPNGSADTATFATSSKTGVSTSANTEVNGIVFNAGASAFTITAGPTFTLTISGVGITNNSGITQNFLTSVDANGNKALLSFTNSASAGSLTIFTNSRGGFMQFFNTSTAGNGTFTNNGGAVISEGGGRIDFRDTSTAGNGTFSNNGSALSGAGAGEVNFIDSSTAANCNFTNNGGAGGGGNLQFCCTSTGGNGTFTNNGGQVSGAGGGGITFSGTSTAGTGAFTINGAPLSDAGGGIMQFFETSTAGNATITINGGAVSGSANGGQTYFFGASTAGSATLIANGGVSGGAGALIRFDQDSVGGTARVEVFGNGTGDPTNGNLDIRFHNAPGVAIGSIEGSGLVFPGSNNLTVGSNNKSTSFSGVIDDGGGGGSLSKIGKGKLTLTKANTYTGGTTITKGALLAKNKSGSATGTGPVQVNAGTLGGTGKISGVVTIGNGSTSGAILLPGTAKKPGTLTINSTLTFKSLSTYECVLNRATPAAGKVSVLGVTINSGATFSFLDTGTGTLATGTVFTVINNTSASPVAGTFSNLTNGAVFASNGSNFQVSYTGGTGNDLTLTVVP